MLPAYHNTGTSHADHTKFGGLIFPSDFNTECRKKGYAASSAIAARIVQDRNFDEQCRKNRSQKTIFEKTGHTKIKKEKAPARRGNEAHNA